MITQYFAHAGEDHEETVVEGGFLDSLTHLPTWVSLIIIAFVLFGVYMLLEKVGIKPMNRILFIIPLLIVIAIVYMTHAPIVSSIVLSVGFVASFALAFTLLSDPKETPKSNGKS